MVLRALLASVIASSIPAGLTGSWTTVAPIAGTNTVARWTFSTYANGDFAFSIGKTLFFDDGKAVVAGDRITFTERDARGEKCSGTVRSGSYRWRVAGRTLTLTAISDRCAWRRSILTARALTRSSA